MTQQRIGILGGAFDPPHNAHVAMAEAALWGGAFDPPHNAHVAMAEAALVQFQLDHLHIVPTGDAWHKPRALSGATHRAQMARLAFGHLAGVTVNEVELQRQGPSYTIDLDSQ